MNMHAMGDNDFPDGARVGADAVTAATRPREPTASSGFGSPGSDFTVRRIDLNDALIRHPQATFVMRASGVVMAGAGVSGGDVLLVDRAVTPQHGHLVIAKVDGDLPAANAENTGLQVHAFGVVRCRIDLRLALDDGLPGCFAAYPTSQHVRPNLHEDPPRSRQPRMVVGGGDLVLLLVG